MVRGSGKNKKLQTPLSRRVTGNILKRFEFSVVGGGWVGSGDADVGGGNSVVAIGGVVGGGNSVVGGDGVIDDSGDFVDVTNVLATGVDGANVAVGW